MSQIKYFIKDKINYYGKGEFVKYVLKAIFYKLFRISWFQYYLMEYLIDYHKVENCDDFPICKLCIKDFEKGDLSYFTPKKLTLYQQWFQDPYKQAYGIFFNGQLVSSAWISYRELYLSEKYIFNLKKDAALLLDMYSHPNYRNKGFYKTIHLFCLKKIYENGRPKALTIIRKNNRPALKHQMKTGFSILHKYVRFQIWGKEFINLKYEDISNKRG